MLSRIPESKQRGSDETVYYIIWVVHENEIFVW